jgi:hypothetical protein
VNRQAGHSIVELLLAMTLIAALAGAVFALTRPSDRALSLRGEEADMQQRLRVAADTVTRDLLMAGAGAYQGSSVAALTHYLAPVLPFRLGAIRADPPGTYRPDVVTIFYVPSTSAQTTTTTESSSASTEFSVNTGPGCPNGQLACGFKAGDTALVFDGSGGFDTFAISGISGGGGSWSVNRPAGGASSVYAAGSTIVKVVQRTYSLKADPATGLRQLAMYDGGANPDAPAVDHLVGFSVEYLGDPQPPVLTRPLTEPIGPWTTYGPRPPAEGLQTTGYPAGENCVFAFDASTGQHTPRLDVLGADPTRSMPIALSPAQLTDGPWCPDATHVNRFDADLLRVRQLVMTLRIEAAADSLRGPAGPLFSRGGSSTNALGWLSDREIRLTVSPRNLNLGH